MNSCRIVEFQFSSDSSKFSNFSKFPDSRSGSFSLPKFLMSPVLQFHGGLNAASAPLSTGSRVQGIPNFTGHADSPIGRASQLRVPNSREFCAPSVFLISRYFKCSDTSELPASPHLHFPGYPIPRILGVLNFTEFPCFFKFLIIFRSPICIPNRIDLKVS